MIISCICHSYIMFRLPPPPQFNLPPPPMPVSDLIDTELISQLTCSSIRQQSQKTIDSSRLILFTSACALTAIVLLTITLIIFLLIRKKKQIDDKPIPKSTIVATTATNPFNRSYTSVSSSQTGIYIDSINTSATTCSIDTNSEFCFECHRHRSRATTPYYQILSIPDVVPN